MEFQQEEEHLDPTSEITIDIVKERAVKGVAILTGRTFILNLISLGATGLLTVFLNPSEFGIFFIVSAIVNFLAYFSDIGLAAALIQKKEKVSEKDLRTTFTVQQLLVLIILIIIFAATPLFSKILPFRPRRTASSLCVGFISSLFLSENHSFCALGKTT